MKMRKTVVCMISIMAILALGGPVTSARAEESYVKQEKNFNKKSEAKHQRMFKELGLTDEQQKTLEANKSAHRERMKASFASMKMKREALDQELEKETVDVAKATQINNELKASQAAMLDDKLAGILEVRKILTPEQYKKFMAKKEAWGKRGKKNKKKERASCETYKE